MRIIDNKASGQNIKQLITQNNLKISDIQKAMCFNTPQSIYKWYSGKTLPNLDNLIILSDLLGCSIDNIIVTKEI